MSIWYNHLQTSICLEALKDNYRMVCAVAANPAAVIKSDAYGHGIREVGGALYDVGARIMAAGTVREAAVLKEHLPRAQVLSLLGPLDAEDYQILETLEIIPFVGRQEQLLLMEDAGLRCGKMLPIALKFDTGMARLGFGAQELPGVLSLLDELRNVRPTHVCSHLATADDPNQIEYVEEQGRIFSEILLALRRRGHDVQGSLANSGAIFGYPALHHELQRPGIALYGCNPFYGTAWESKASGLKPAMEVSTRLLQIRSIGAGQTVSYGRTFTATRNMRIGIVAVGYADNYSRGLSNTAQMLVRGKRVPVLGRVCMQLTAVDLSRVPEAREGDIVFLLGGVGPDPILPEELAVWWQTITYEVFCLLGQNPREYR